MKKSLIIFGSLIVIALLSVLVYILLPQENSEEEGVFARFGLGDTTDTISVVPPTNEDLAPETEFRSTESLRQLTTRPVVGYSVVQQSASSSPAVYFMEAGTGHIYKINVDGQNETRISNITIPGVTAVEFTEAGEYAVAIGGEITVIQISTNDSSVPRTFSVADRAVDQTIIDDTLLYTTNSFSSTEVKTLVLGSSQSPEVLFTIPFRNAVVTWGSEIEGSHLFYPKPARELEGYLYSFSDQTTTRLPISGFGLTALHLGPYTLYNHTDSVFVSGVYEPAGFATLRETSNLLFTEKCSQVSDSSLLCGYDSTLSADKIDAWRLGTHSFSDAIMLVNFDSSRSEILDGSSGNLDLYEPVFNKNAGVLLFKNKKTGNLWLFELNETIN